MALLSAFFWPLPSWWWLARCDSIGRRLLRTQQGRLPILGVAPPNPPAFLSPRICCANTRPSRSSDDDLINAASWRIAFAAYRNVSDRGLPSAIFQRPQCRFAIRQPLQRSDSGVLKDVVISLCSAVLKQLYVQLLIVFRAESCFRAILNHGNVPQNACIALLRVSVPFY